jgi:hypothetical protein
MMMMRKVIWKMLMISIVFLFLSGIMLLDLIAVYTILWGR